MSYLALYRKWRPKVFSDVIGQEHLVKILKNQIISNRVAHAYLFCGTRGTGKTTLAKIFAKAVNCEEPVNGEPCLKCSTCKDIESGNTLEIVEIDAASNNGVDNIRQIRDEVQYSPTKGKYKVYIIDEVHMLSTGAFNALLKTLEEPPAHIIFILATTDPQKIPATILSRVQRYDLRRISTEDILSKLKYYMQADGINIEEAALKYIAGLGDGSMRDALSILEQCVSFSNGEIISLSSILDLLGAVDASVMHELFEMLINKEGNNVLDFIEKISLQGRDFQQFVLDFIKYLRNVLVAKTSNNLAVSQENQEKLKMLSEKTTVEYILFLINSFSEIENKMKYASQKRITLEVELIKLLSTGLKTTSQQPNSTPTKNQTVEEFVSSESEDLSTKDPLGKAFWDVAKTKFDNPLKALLQDSTGYVENSFFIIKFNDALKLDASKRYSPIINSKVNEVFKNLKVKMLI